jgi:hypothetical protein
MPRDGKSTDGLSARWVKNLIAELKIRSIECNLLSLFKGLQKYRQKYILIWSTNNHGSYLNVLWSTLLQAITSTKKYIFYLIFGGLRPIEHIQPPSSKTSVFRDCWYHPCLISVKCQIWQRVTLNIQSMKNIG